MTRPAPAAPVPLLFLTADTGGGHRAAAQAIGDELARLYPGRFSTVCCDPLAGPGASRLLRWITGRYGPTVRLAPWLWGAAWQLTRSRPALWLLRRWALAPARRPVQTAVAALRPAAIVCLHPLTGAAAAAARARLAPEVPLVTVVTDLVRPHPAWGSGPADRLVVPTAAAGQRWAGAGPAMVAGLPVRAAFTCGPASARERAALRRSLGLPTGAFLVVLTGGGEGCGQMARYAAALLRRPGVHVVAICGRNVRLRRRLDRMSRRCGGRLTVLGFTADLASWLRCADVVAGKAGPGTIAEATCCGAPLLLTSELPGQERGNAAFVAAAGAGRYVPGPRRLAAAAARLRADPAELAAMRGASAGLGRPDAASDIATLLAGLADPRPQAMPSQPGSRSSPGAPRPLVGAGRG